MKRAWILLLAVCPVWAQSSVDWDQQKTEILKHYRDLIQIDTRAGNETKAVDYIRQVLEAEGIPTQTFALDPARANLVARLKGNGSKRPLLILAHTDVVGVQREKWPVDPFSAAIKDGYVWGRGSLDDKPMLTANLMVMLLLKRNHVALDRDVIFLAESGEEADTTGVGINFMVNQHYDEIDAEYSLTEGGGATHRRRQSGDHEHRHGGKGSRARAPGGHRNVRPRLRAAHGQRADSPGRGGGKGRPLGDADAPERHHAHLFRKARHHQPAREGGALQRPAESANRAKPRSIISGSMSRRRTPCCGLRWCPPCSRPASART